MNSKDIEYLFLNSSYSKKNLYPQSIIRDTLRVHTNFLSSSNIKYKTSSKMIKDKKRKYIHVFRADNDTEIAKVSSVSYMDTNTFIGSYFANDKFKTEKYLKKFNINTPNSKIYDENELEKAKKETFSESSDSVVIKPLISTMSQGVKVNVSEEKFNYNWNKSIQYARPSKGKMLVQNYLDGFEARASIVQGKLLSIMARIPPYVIGNGKEDVKTLIENKSEDRQGCGFLRKIHMSKPESYVDFLDSHGISLKYVPNYDEFILLSSISNVAYGGGEIMNITHLVSTHIKDTALNALAVMPGLYTAGVDLIMNNFDDKNPVVLEINPFPGISNTIFPTYGEPTNFSKNYFESVVSLDQFLNNPDYKYYIEEDEDYIRAYLKFENRRNKMLKNNYLSLKDLL